MTRVDESREAQRAKEAERQTERANKEKTRTEKDDFSRLVAQKQETAAKAKKEGDIKKGEDVGQQQKAQNRLLARQGIRSTSFQQKLHQQGKQNLGNQQMQTKSRQTEGKQTKRADTQKQTETDTKTDNKRIDAKSDKLAAISRDQRGSGGGGTDSDGEMGSDSKSQQQFGAMAQGSAQAAGTSAPAQAAQAGSLPAAILQQLVERVLVGINKEGLGEFHIEFKENVLNGSSLTVTADNGKINAKFFTHDKNVGRLLKASEGELMRAFSKKGLSLEKLEVEAPE